MNKTVAILAAIHLAACSSSAPGRPPEEHGPLVRSVHCEDGVSVFTHFEYALGASSLPTQESTCSSPDDRGNSIAGGGRGNLCTVNTSDSESVTFTLEWNGGAERVTMECASDEQSPRWCGEFKPSECDVVLGDDAGQQ